MSMDLDTATPIHTGTPSHTAVEKANSIHSDDAISISSPQTLDVAMTSASTSSSMPHLYTFNLSEQSRAGDAVSSNPIPSGSRIQLPPHLVQDLLDAFMHTPFSYHPIIPYDRVRANLAGHGWQLSLLPPQERVLVHCIHAITAITSTDPFIVGPGPLPPECQNITTTLYPVKTIKVDLREVGRRRESICQQLRVEALRQAQLEGTAITLSQENAASCYLLDALQTQYDGSNVYASAFAWQVCSLAESWCRHPQPTSTLFGTSELSARWRSFIMADAITSLAMDRPLSFSAYDEKLLCGHAGYSLERLDFLLKKGCNIGQFFSYFSPIVFQIVRLARETYENVTGGLVTAFARRYPINENILKKHYASLSMLCEVCEKYAAQTSHLMHGQSKRSVFAFESCSTAVSMGWTNLVLCLYNSLKSRLEESAMASMHADPYAIFNSEDERHEDDAHGAEQGSSSGEQTSPSDSKMAAAESMFLEVRDLTCRAAIAFSKMIDDMPLLTRLTHAKLVGGNLKKWAHFLIEVAEGKVMSTTEAIEALQRLRDALKLAGFSWIDYTDLVEVIDSQITTLMAGSIPQTTIPQQSNLIYDSLFSDLGPMGCWNMNMYTLNSDSINSPQFQHPTGFS
ncbi:hypothetical protein VKT23_006436 [Stygiomarasmius scandens]|uniref:Transcription factor domain-containing protein n=1 Tax=Marasmiellus scandens TaxID=2682957 RepID=A0ABR1JMT1_9AGAR